MPPRHGDIALVMELVEGDDLLAVMLNALTLPERQHWLPAPGPEPHLPDAALRIPVKNELPLQLGHVEVALALGPERQLRHVRHSDEETVAVSEDGEGGLAGD